jgi:hypothetical protein
MAWRVPAIAQHIPVIAKVLSGRGRELFGGELVGRGQSSVCLHVHVRAYM